MPLNHAYNQTVADGTATSVVRPSDWNSAHNEVMYLSGNTNGVSSVSGTNIVIQGGNNLTVSGVQGANAATIIISGNNTGTTFNGTGVNGSMTFDSNGLRLDLSKPELADNWYAVGNNTIPGTATSGTFSGDSYVLSGAGNLIVGVSSNTLILSASEFTRVGWEPFPPVHSTTSTPGLNSIYVQRLYPEHYIAFSNIERRLSNNFSSSTNQQSVSYTFDYGLYTKVNATQASLVSSDRVVMQASYNSATAVGFTISQGTTSYTITSNTTNVASLFTGFKHWYMPMTSTLQPSQEYWFGMRMSSAGSTNPLRVGIWDQTVINNLTIGKLYGTTVSASNSTFVGDFNQGVLSATSSVLPSTIGLSQLTNAVSQARMYLQFD